jgi:hypothetical protein
VTGGSVIAVSTACPICPAIENTIETAEEAGTIDGRGISASGIAGGGSCGPCNNGLTGRRFRSAAARSAPA